MFREKEQVRIGTFKMTYYNSDHWGTGKYACREWKGKRYQDSENIENTKWTFWNWIMHYLLLKILLDEFSRIEMTTWASREINKMIQSEEEIRMKKWTNRQGHEEQHQKI